MMKVLVPRPALMWRGRSDTEDDRLVLTQEARDWLKEACPDAHRVHHPKIAGYHPTIEFLDERVALMFKMAFG